MQNSRDDLSQVVFKRLDHINLSEHKLEIEMLNVAWAMDGNRSLDVIAREDHYDLKDLTKKVVYLLDKGLIRVSKGSQSIIDQEFIDLLNNQLSKSLGPVAAMLITDTARDIGNPITNFPADKLESLIDLLTQEIPVQEDAIAFKRVMAAMVKEKNY